MDKVIIFGAAGFVGSYLLSELPAKSFHAVDVDDCIEADYGNGKFRIHFVDVTNYTLFDRMPRKGISCVINLASLQPDYVSKEDFNPVNYVYVNTIGTLNILNWCIRNKIEKFIQVVSHRSVVDTRWVSVSDFAPYNIDYGDEFAEFAVSEMAAIEMIHCYIERYGIQGIILRVPAIFGYGSHLEGYKDGKRRKTGFQIFIDRAVAGRPLEIWGDRSISRDIVYVKDVVGAILYAMCSNAANGLYNISGGGLTLDEEAKNIIEVFSSKPGSHKIIYKPYKKNDIVSCHYNTERAAKQLGWRQRYSFKGMLMDYKKEKENGRFRFLVEARAKKMGR